MSSPFTFLIILLTGLLSWQAFEKRRLADRLVLWPPALSRHRQYDRLVTYGFIHADWAHLIFNMITLFFFGRQIEQLMIQLTGSLLTFPLFYLAALLVSVLPSYLKHKDNPNYLCLGASGAVTAVLFAFILLSPWTWIFVLFLPVPAILYAVFYVGYSLWMDRQGRDNINHSAHLAGAAFGVLFMLCMEPAILGHFLQRVASPSLPF